MKKAIGIIFCLGVIVYSNTFFCSFHFDDLPSIVENPAIKNIHHLANVWQFLPRRFILYSSIALNYHFGQLNVFGYHLLNLLVHLFAAILVSWLTLLTLSTPVMKGEKISSHAGIISLFTGLIFVAHPVQTEAVTYIIQRAASMAALFYLASLCFYVKSRMCNFPPPCGEGKGGGFYYISSLIMAVMAMFTKETAITLPLMVLLYEFCFFKDGLLLKTFGGDKLKRLTPFLLTLLIIPLTMAVTETNASRLEQLRNEPGVSSLHYLLTQLRVMLTYVRLSFFPFHQNLDYDYPVFKNIFQLPVVTGLLFLISVLFCAKQLFIKYRLLSFSILWFFLTLLPESSFLPIKDVIYEHRLYLPMAGFSIFLVSSVYYLIDMGCHSESEERRILRQLMVMVLTLMVACYSLLTYQRNKVWQDEITLWSDVIQKSPHKPRGYVNLALAYEAQGNTSQALSNYDKAIEVDTNYADAYYNRGLEYYRTHQLDNALGDFNKAIALNPKYAASYNNRGLVYFYQGNVLQALSDYTKAIEIKPDYAASYNNRAIAYYRIGKYGEAWADVHQAQGLGFTINAGFINALQRHPPNSLQAGG